MTFPIYGDGVRCLYRCIYCLAPQKDAACSSSVSAKKKQLARAQDVLSRECKPWHTMATIITLWNPWRKSKPKDSWWVQLSWNASAFRKTAELGSQNWCSLHCLILFGSSGISKRLLFWCLLLCHCASHHGEIPIAQQLFVANGPGQHLAGNPP